MSLDEMVRFISSIVTRCTDCPAKKEYPDKINCCKSSDCYWNLEWWMSQQAKNDK